MDLDQADGFQIEVQPVGCLPDPHTTIVAITATSIIPSKTMYSINAAPRSFDLLMFNNSNYT
jgi:hypothetical protein